MDEFLSLLVDPSHWGFELVSGAIIGATLTPVWRFFVRKHDAKRHPRHDHTEVYVAIEELRMELWSVKQQLTPTCHWCGRTNCDH